MDELMDLPQRKRVIVTILDEPVAMSLGRNRQAWKSFLDAMSECDEPLDGEPERMSFHRSLS
jgi:hypothetical protein